jgi:ABC-2 type transport system permease protein
VSPARVTFRRTVGMAKSLYATAFAFAGFLAASAALFAFNLDAAEGGRTGLAPLWAVSVSPVLPVLAALFGMDVWSDERKSGRIDLLLSSPVRESDLVLGKFFGVWFLSAAGIAVSLVSSLVFLGWYAPALAGRASLPGFIPAFLALAVQSALWSAVAVAASALSRNAAAAATATIALAVALPRGAWFAASSWGAGGRFGFGEFPLDAHAFDFASGLVSSGTAISYAVFTWAALFAATQAVSAARLGGRSLSAARLAAFFTVVLALVFAVLASTLALRLDKILDIPLGGTAETHFSDRTHGVLAEGRGTVDVTAFLERKDPRFRETAHFLRAIKREADAASGMGVTVRYVDPVLDLGEAQRLVRKGVPKGSIVFERNGRVADAMPLGESGCGEREFVSVLERISTPFRRSCVYWTAGHGEALFDDYGPEGASDIARDLALDGYASRRIDLAGSAGIADDCALIVVAGPRTDFSTVELDRLRAYLDGGGSGVGGGRLLALVGSGGASGLSSLLSEWGARPSAAQTPAARTISGTDAIVDDFDPDHPVSRPFAGQQVVLERPVAFSASAAASASGSGADRKRYSELLRAGGQCLAAAVERGEAASDLAVRPTRIVAVGDVGFVMNAKLRAYANANRDFFLNSVKWLSGRDAMTESGTEKDRLVSGMDRAARARFAAVTAAAFPFAVFVLAMALTFRKRRRP